MDSVDYVALLPNCPEAPLSADSATADVERVRRLLRAFRVLLEDCSHTPLGS